MSAEKFKFTEKDIKELAIDVVKNEMRVEEFFEKQLLKEIRSGYAFFVPDKQEIENVLSSYIKKNAWERVREIEEEYIN